MEEERKKGYSPPKVDEAWVKKLRELRRQKNSKEFTIPRKSLHKGYPITPPANLPPS